jgi:hypothetical protein
LGFTSSADYAIICFDLERFAVIDFIDAYRASVYAGFASATNIVVDYYFDHFSILGHNQNRVNVLLKIASCHTALKVLITILLNRHHLKQNSAALKASIP